MHIQRSLANMVFCGAFHRFPNLHIVSAENDAGWVPYFLERLDYLFTNPRRRTYQHYFIKDKGLLPSEYIGPVMQVANERRGQYLNTEYLDGRRAILHYELPLAEVVIDFYDRLKSVSRGYASFDYEPKEMRAGPLVKLDILINGEPLDALSAIVYRDKAYEWGRQLCAKLKELIPRQMFEVVIQAAVGSKVIAREVVRPFRKNVIAKCYGGDITRKRKLLDRQKEGKKRMKQFGKVEIPQEAFLAALRMDS